MRLTPRVSAVFLSLLIISGCNVATTSSPPPLTVLVAASAAQAVSEVTKDFERATGTKVHVSSGPSNGLAQQILSGAPADIFISASPQWTQLLKDQGLSVRSENLFANQMVLIVPSDPRDENRRIQNLKDFLQDPSTRIAIAGEQVPAGVYAEAVLRDTGWYERLREARQIVRGSDARSTTNFVARGEADAGIIYKTDALPSPDLKIVATFENDPGILYTIGLLKPQRHDHPESQALYDKLKASTETWTRYGFQR